MYNRKEEYIKWKIKKEKEEQQLRENGIDEHYIMILREMDKIMFNQERNFKRYQYVTKDVYFLNTMDVRNQKSYVSLNDLVDEIEDEALLTVILESNELAKQIIEMRYQGYNVREISNYIGISSHKIYRIIRKIKEKYHKMRKN